jgi:hypothetical protein
MKATNTHFTCSKCGATWNEVAKIKHYDLVVPRYDRGIVGTTGSPSDALVAEVQRARAAAGLDAVLPKRRVIGIGKEIKGEEDATNI